MFDVRPLSGSFGAEVIGFTIGENNTAEQVEAVKALWAKHKILLFREQSMDEKVLVDFSRQFGELADYLFDCSPHVLKVQVMTSRSPFNPLLLFKILDE